MENRLRLPVLAASKLAPTFFDKSHFTIGSFRENHGLREENDRLGEFGIAPAFRVKRHEIKSGQYVNALAQYAGPAQREGTARPGIFGLDQASFRELAVLERHCQAELGLSNTSCCAPGPSDREGVRLGLSGKRAYSVLLQRRNSSIHHQSLPARRHPK